MTLFLPLADPHPQLLYPLSDKSQGRDLTGRGSDVILYYLKIEPSDLPGASLPLMDTNDRYAYIPKHDYLKFTVSNNV